MESNSAPSPTSLSCFNASLMCYELHSCGGSHELQLPYQRYKLYILYTFFKLEMQAVNVQWRYKRSEERPAHTLVAYREQWAGASVLMLICINGGRGVCRQSMMCPMVPPAVHWLKLHPIQWSNFDVTVCLQRKRSFRINMYVTSR